MVKKSEQKMESEPSSKAMPSTPASASASASAAAACKKMKKYKGVRMRSWGSWVSEIRAPNQKTRIWLGSYSTPEAAARAYDAALLCLKGTSANLNFPVTTSSHYNINPDGGVMSPKSIQRLAAAAANSFVETSSSTTTTTTTTPISSSFSSSSSSISSPSPSMSSPSPISDQLDDDGSLIQSFETYYNEPNISMMEPLSWYNFDGLLQSPKYVDQMLFNTTVSFDPPPVPVIDDFLEDGDIRLWSFC